jgi:hypothetical protein
VIYTYNKIKEVHKILKFIFGKALHVSGRFCVHNQESSTVHTAIHTGFSDCLLASTQHNLYDIYLLLCIQC